MAIDSDAKHRRSLRLPGYDYASPGAYFITTVTKNRECLFENLAFKALAEEAWLWLAERYPYVLLDEFVVMPNHVHGILLMTDIEGGTPTRRGDSRVAPTGGRALKPLGQLVGAFKTVSARSINLMRDSPGVPVWQRNYHERIIRDEAELNRIRQYIIDNPTNWSLDPENPVATAESAATALFPC